MNYTAGTIFLLPKQVFGLGLSTGELAVYTYLMYLEDRKKFQCWPSYGKIGSAIAKSKNSVKKYVDGLVEKQLITVEPTRVITQGGEARNGSLLYTLQPISRAVDYFNERQYEKALMENERRRVEKLSK